LFFCLEIYKNNIFYFKKIIFDINVLKYKIINFFKKNIIVVIVCRSSIKCYAAKGKEVGKSMCLSIHNAIFMAACTTIFKD